MLGQSAENKRFSGKLTDWVIMDRWNGYREAMEATGILIQNIEGKAKKPVHTILPTKLIIRNTTAKYRR